MLLDESSKHTVAVVEVLICEMFLCSGSLILHAIDIRCPPLCLARAS